MICIADPYNTHRGKVSSITYHTYGELFLCMKIFMNFATSLKFYNHNTMQN